MPATAFNAALAPRCLAPRSLAPRSLAVLAGLALAVSTPVASAQDSVAQTPGGNDALSSTDTATQRVRYVLDLTAHNSSWGNTFRIGPVAKASRDVNPLFPTKLLAGLALSPVDQLDPAAASSSYSLWTTTGAGVNPNQNGAASSIASPDFDRLFGLGFSDLSGTATNAFSLRIGQTAADPSRLFVERTVAAISRIGSDDQSSLSLGGVDADGIVTLRADDFNATGPTILQGENVLTIDPEARNDSIANIVVRLAGGNAATDPAATTYFVNDGDVTLNVPTMLQHSGAAASRPGIFSFDGQFQAGAAAPTTVHLDPAADSTRGNPAFAAVSLSGSQGVLASIAKTDPAQPAQSIMLSGLDAAGAPLSTRLATLPSPISTTGFAANAGGDAAFDQYFSQVSFRGPSGLVGLGSDGGTTIAAATATDPFQGPFLAVASFGPTVTWDVAAWAGKPVLNGPGGSQIGALANLGPAGISAPAIDDFGNVYFVAGYQPTTGPAAIALFKAHPLPSAGYELELVVRTGQELDGRNSDASYTITDLVLADSDSIAAGAFHNASLLPAPAPGAGSPAAADPAAFGGAVVAATIEYNRNGVPEPYNVVLFVGPDVAGVSPCDGDANGDGLTNADDLLAVLGNFGLGQPGLEPADGDLNDDDLVNADDLLIVLGNFGCD